MKYLLLLSILILSGCMSIPSTESMATSMFNIPTSGYSEFDGTKHIRMSNMGCINIRFELYQDTLNAEKGIVLLKAGTNTITNIGNDSSLNFRLDDGVHSFSASSLITEHEATQFKYGITSNFSYKTYILPEKFIRKIANSDTFIAKVNLLNNTYLEGKCSTLTLKKAREMNQHSDIQITQETLDISNKIVAITGFRKFVEMMNSANW
ncbi:hypothetical protein V5096_06045 [Pseudoalteromonas carrageenovora]|uniref:hypothetical protein n=1 Tax=Pseudoalteromonas carrageenovora TaxID=227 RepID=UPI002FD444A0